MRKACLGRARASRGNCFHSALFFVLKEQGAAQAEAEVDADVAADRPTRLTSAAPTTERRRRGSSGRAAQREAV
jgi:organic hydroperoxide reductase OsmC/OhrA